MEYAMMVSMGAVSQSTIVVTIVHDCQVSKENHTDYFLLKSNHLINLQSSLIIIAAFLCQFLVFIVK